MLRRVLCVLSPSPSSQKTALENLLTVGVWDGVITSGQVLESSGALTRALRLETLPHWSAHPGVDTRSLHCQDFEFVFNEPNMFLRNQYILGIICLLMSSVHLARSRYQVFSDLGLSLLCSLIETEAILPLEESLNGLRSVEGAIFLE